jgi:ATP-binding cassette subfamily C protein/ATP-binding cassette subfamily C protein LapB
MNAFPGPDRLRPEAGGASAGAMTLLLQTPPGLDDTDLARCFSAFLAVVAWEGNADDMLGALPHAEPRPDLTGIRNALARLGYPTRPQRLRRGGLDRRLLPALLVRPGRAAAILYRDPQGGVVLFDGATGIAARCAPAHLSGTLYVPVPGEPVGARYGWVGSVTRRLAGSAPALLGLSALVTLLGLAVPLFTMLVFDLVVASRRPEALDWLLGGAVAAVAAEITFRAARQRALARIGERLDRLVSTAVFGQLLALPAALIERAGTAAQVSRLRDFGAIRETLTGAFALAVLDLPFTVIVLALMVVLGGWIAVVPVFAALGFVALHLISRGAVRRAVNHAAQAAHARDVLSLELLEAHRSLQLAGAAGRWSDAYAEAAARAATASAHAAALNGRVMAAAGAIVTLSALAAMTLGAGAVMAGAMTAGGLIAGMMLIWRVLAPMQSGFLMLSRWQQTCASIRQVDGMMALEPERSHGAGARLGAPQTGDIAFHRVSLRYLPTAEPVLAGVSFAIRHGEMVAVTGGDGTGKSTLLKLVAGLYRPNGGVVRIGGHDLRSFDPAVLRRAVAYVPQAPHLLYGTIAQNLRLALPTATEAELRRACAEAHVLNAVLALPDGFETRVGDNATAGLPRSLLVRLCLARALLRDAPVLLLDEPVTGLDDAAADAFAAVVAARRGRTTIVMTTHRPSHMRLADRVLRIEDGAVEEVPPQGAAGRPGPARLAVFQPQGGAR